MTAMIQLLPDHVANQIAAGEVVQRPASVVKELLENAIDAQATAITLVIKEAGKTLIQVIDDGMGMNTTDARLCFERHATSKIKTAQDLFNLHTKGFRGEALASIAAIAHVTLKTKTSDAEVGTHICIEGSEIITQDVAVTPKGTIITVKNLFYNIPARRNFLKSNPVETRHIIDEFHRVALAHPNLAFTMIHNGNDVFKLPASNLRQRIVNILGTKTNEKLVPIDEDTEIVKLEGFVIKPQFAKKGRGEQFFFVNDRFIKSGYLHHAVLAAFEGLIKEGNQPGYFLYLQVDPNTIDINIHPTKTEIKFENEHAIYAMLRAAVKHSLGQFNIAPVIDFNKDNGFETPYAYSKKTPEPPSIEVDKDFNPFSTEKKSKAISFTFKREVTPAWDSLYTGLKDVSKTLKGEPEPFSNHTFEQDAVELTSGLFENQSQTTTKVTFQIQQKYIVSPIKTGVIVMHMHRAHHRVLYEELLKNITVKEGVSQQLLFPLLLHFSTIDIQVLQKVQEQLEGTGFAFSDWGADTVQVKGIPAMISESQVENLLSKLVNDIQEEVPDAHFSHNDLLAKSLSRNMAIKTGQALKQEEQEHLIHQLFACKEPSISPDNKQVLITMNVNDFDKKFM